MRLTSVLAGVLFVAFLATPALAGPGKGGADRPQTQDLEKQIQQLTKELKQLEKKLEKAKAAQGPAEKAAPAAEESRRALAEQQRRMAEARRRLAGLLAERGRDGAAGTPRAPKAPKPPQAVARRGPAPSDRAPEWMGAMRRLHEQDRQLAARVQVLEQQIRRIGAAIGKLSGSGRGPDARPGRGPNARPGRGPDAQRGPGPERAGPGGSASVEARLARLERAVRALVAKARRGGMQRGAMRMRDGAQGGGPRWMRRAHARGAQRGMGQEGGGPRGMRHPGRGGAPGMGPGMGPGDGPERGGRQAARRGGPRWNRMLPAMNRMHGPAARGAEGPRGGPRASGRPGGRMGEGPMQRDRGPRGGPCPSCGS